MITAHYPARNGLFPPLYFPDVQFVTKAGTGLLSVRRENGLIVHESIVPDQVPNISKTWTSMFHKRDAILEAEELARALTAVMDGRVISKASVDSTVDHYSRSCGSYNPADGTIRNDGPIWDKRPSDDKDSHVRYTFLDLSMSARNLDPTSRNLPAIRVQSGNIHLVSTHVDMTWIMTSNVPEAWIKAAKSAERYGC